MSFQVEKDEGTAARRRVPFRVFKSNGTSPDTTFSTATVLQSLNGGAQAVSTNSSSVVSANAGMYYLELTAAEVATLGSIALYVDAQAADFEQHVANVQVVNSNPFSTESHGAYLQPTTAGRTLDVTAGGTAGIDWGNLENPTTANDLSGTTVKDVQDTLNVNVASIDAANYSGVSVGLTDSAISFLTGATWDEELTGATHNVVNSAGRRLRGLQDFAGYALGAIWIDTVNGTAGTTNFENGTVNNPVDTIADALTLATSLGIRSFRVLPNSLITLAAAVENYIIEGQDYGVNFGSQSVGSTYISGASVRGTYSNRPTLANCLVNDITGGPANLHQCGLASAVTANATGDWFIHHSFSGVAGTGTPVFDFGSAVGNTNLNMRHYSGGIQIQGMGAGTDNMSLEGNGQLVIDSTCTAGTVAIRGNFTVTDNASGAVTLSDEARFEVQQITGGTYALNTTASGNVGIDWANVENPTTENDLSGTTVKDVQDAVSISDGAITTATFGAGAIDAAALATDAGQEIADRVLLRNIEGGDDSSRSVGQALGALRNRTQLSNVSYIVYQNDDSTVWWHGSLTTVSNTVRITDVNPD